MRLYRTGERNLLGAIHNNIPWHNIAAFSGVAFPTVARIFSILQEENLLDEKLHNTSRMRPFSQTPPFMMIWRLTLSWSVNSCRTWIVSVSWQEWLPQKCDIMTTEVTLGLYELKSLYFQMMLITKQNIRGGIPWPL